MHTEIRTIAGAGRAFPGESASSSRRRGAALLVPILLFALVLVPLLLIFPVRYEANDDFAIVRQLNPKNGFPTDPHLFYQAWIAGRGLHALYALAPSVPWFGLLLLIGLILGGGLIGGVAWRSAGGRMALAWAPALALVLLSCALFMSFTSTALLLVVGGTLILLEKMWSERASGPMHTGAALDAGGDRARACEGQAVRTAVALTAFVLAFLLRWKLVSIVLAGIALPLLLLGCQGRIRRGLPFALALLAFFAADRAIERWTGGEAWRQFGPYNAARARFHDTTDGDFRAGVTEGALERAGWTREDYQAFRAWVIYDETLFRRETLERFLQANATHESRLAALPSLVKTQLGRHGRYPAAALCALLAILALAFPRIKNMETNARLRLLLSLGLLTAALIGLLGYRFLPRVFLPLLAGWMGFACLLAARSRAGSSRLREPADDACRAKEARAAKSSAHRKGRSSDRSMAPGRQRRAGGRGRVAVAVLMGALALAISLAQASAIAATLRGSARMKAHTQAALQGLAARDGDAVIVLMDAVRGLHFESIHPLKEFADLAPVKVLPGGTTTHSPRFQAMMKSMGLSGGRDLLAWLIDNPNALLALEAQSDAHARAWVSLWLSYLERHGIADRPLAVEPAFDFRERNGSGWVFFRIVTSAARAEQSRESAR